MAVVYPLRDSSVNIPLPPDHHHCSDEAKWRIGGTTDRQHAIESLHQGGQTLK